MQTVNWRHNETDEKLKRQYLERIPEKVMDVHVHIYRKADIGTQGPAYEDGPDEVGIRVYEEQMRRLVGSRCSLSGIYVAPPTQTKEQIPGANRFTLAQLDEKPDARGLMLIAPDMDEALVRSYLEDPRVVGFKPFCTYGDFRPDYEAPLGAFLPEWAWRMADERGLMMLVHLMTFDALNNPGNYGEILRMCARYPNVKLMLDHAARGFHTRNTAEGLQKIRHLDNVWLDTSSICDPMAFITVIRAMGSEKLLFGTDFPLCQVRGKSVSVGDGFVWLNHENFNWESYAYVCNPALLGIEAIQAVFDAADAMGLSEEEIRHIFYDNAMAMLSRTGGRR